MIRRLIILLLIVGCDLLQEEDVSGCTDSTACNYNTDATIDDNNCAISSVMYDSLIIGDWQLNKVVYYDNYYCLDNYKPI